MSQAGNFAWKRIVPAVGSRALRARQAFHFQPQWIVRVGNMRKDGLSDIAGRTAEIGYGDFFTAHEPRDEHENVVRRAVRFRTVQDGLLHPKRTHHFGKIIVFAFFKRVLPGGKWPAGQSAPLSFQQGWKDVNLSRRALSCAPSPPFDAVRFSWIPIVQRKNIADVCIHYRPVVRDQATGRAINTNYRY